MGALDEIGSLLTQAKRIAIAEYNRTKNDDVMQVIMSVDDAVIWLEDAKGEPAEEEA